MLDLYRKTATPHKPIYIEPCPFCGTNDIGIYFEKYSLDENENEKSKFKSGLSYIWCHNKECGVQTPPNFSMDQTIKIWNRRKESVNISTLEMVSLMRDNVIEMTRAINGVQK